MTDKSQLSIPFIIGVISLLAFSFMAFFVSANKVVQFDSTIITFVQGFENSSLTAVMKFFTFIGDTNSVIVLSILVIIFLYAVLKHRVELILFIVAIIGSAVLNQLLKYSFQRARPELHRLIEIDSYSFPSGHAMNAFTVYTIITFLLWRHIPSRAGRILLIIISALMIFTIGISRIYLGVHYPSDIIAGYFASACWLGMAICFFQKYQENRSRRLTYKSTTS
ncbi:phosphatase PAP2 family protein [Cytobacillus praedii]|uniref:Phosphatase PAP2 family protein n=1 Tax=Cytobacillus praedii TaxID=1742358 RepID=A0A4R1AYJ7_9BACI|nr:phosphatase PAP2 family protein [Cytobacillus praedii]TCJ05668.1 phosphatase PAP2 family protein [Cytobacillus praedii]